jgi:type IV pilus assembly protein PilY1
MTNILKNKFIQLASLVIFAQSANVASAAITDLGTAPLVSTTTGEVLPNLMYVLDNSGSMGI